VPKPNYCDEPVAARYDETSADMFEPDVVEPAVRFLADLAGDGPALEFGIGTGRIALPLDPTRLGFDEYDIASQSLISHHYWITGDHARVESYPGRYVWAAELDLMARLAGMTLRGRWAGWQGEPFTSDSTTHVSVWKKTA
jgi:hypothetical protein